MNDTRSTQTQAPTQVITFFTKPNCPACSKTKLALDDKYLSYNQVNVANDDGYMELQEACALLDTSMPKALPVVIKGNDIWSGEDFYIGLIEGDMQL